MAYGSPERLADVPDYYRDIRGGRPIRPELLEDLVERYRRLGIEDGSPLNAITEQTRAALQAELGMPVFTGMKHWTPRIADAAESALGAGARTVVGLVLACPIGFVSDHLEIRWDIDTEAQEKARELGLRLDRIEMPNADPAFIRVLAGLVRRRLPLPSSAG